jgi:sugar porter (SP) family MFS transporter
MMWHCCTQNVLLTPAYSIGNGVNTATAPIWQTETSQAKWRGKLVVIEMMMNIFGFLMVNWINYGLSFVGGPIAWRLPLALQFVFMFVIWGTVPWLPESPRWLIAHGRDAEALPILADLENSSTSDTHIKARYDEIRYSVDYERRNAVKWGDLLRGRTHDGTKTVRRLLLGAGTQAIQQFEGINVMSYYMPTLLIQSVGMTNSMSRLITACTAVVYLVASGVAAPMVERFGRRIMMMVSTATQLICFLLMSVLLSFANDPTRSDAEVFGKATIVWFFVYYIGFGLGMLGIPWLYPTEINSLPMRTKGAAIATATNWLTNFVVVEITPIGIQTLGWKFYIVWAVLNAVFLPVIYVFYPETGMPSSFIFDLRDRANTCTADRTLEDLDAYYRDDPPLIVINDKDATSLKRPARFIAMEQEDIRNASIAGTEGVHERKVHTKGTKEDEEV